MALNGKQLLARDVAALAYQAGWKDVYQLTKAVAICTAESSRYTEAINTDNPDGSIDYGLWQINSVHFGQKIAGITVNEAALYDTLSNARIAHALWREQGWRPWAAFTSGRYLDAVPGACNGVRYATLVRFGQPLPS